MIDSVRKDNDQPVYQQIVNAITDKIKSGELTKGDQLPSINQLSGQLKLAKETVVKSFRILQQRGVIRSVKGKGYFIRSVELHIEHRIFLLFDTYSAYKEVLYRNIKVGFGKQAVLDIYFHHYNPAVFHSLCKEASGNYTAYLIIPFQHRQLTTTLALLPSDKVLILDQCSSLLSDGFSGVTQDFSNDIYQMLKGQMHNVQKYKALNLAFRNNATEVPESLRTGFVKFCEDHSVPFKVVTKPLQNPDMVKGEGWIVIDDVDLVYLVEQSASQKLQTGRDLGIISYNDTALKKVVMGGISVISTDFEAMGSSIVTMVTESKRDAISNPCHFIDRGSF